MNPNSLTERQLKAIDGAEGALRDPDAGWDERFAAAAELLASFGIPMVLDLDEDDELDDQEEPPCPSS